MPRLPSLMCFVLVPAAQEREPRHLAPPCKLSPALTHYILLLSQSGERTQACNLPPTSTFIHYTPSSPSPRAERESRHPGSLPLSPLTH